MFVIDSATKIFSLNRGEEGLRLQCSGKWGLILALYPSYQFSYFRHDALAYNTSEPYVSHVFLSGDKTQVAEVS